MPKSGMKTEEQGKNVNKAKNLSLGAKQPPSEIAHSAKEIGDRLQEIEDRVDHC